MNQNHYDNALGGSSRPRPVFTAARRREMLPIHRGLISHNAPPVDKSKARQQQQLPPPPQLPTETGISLPLLASPLAAWAQSASAPQHTSQLLLPTSPTAQTFLSPPPLLSAMPLSAMPLPQLTLAFGHTSQQLLPTTPAVQMHSPLLPSTVSLSHLPLASPPVPMFAMPVLPQLLATTAPQTPVAVAYPSLSGYLDPTLIPMVSAAATATMAPPVESALAGTPAMGISPLDTTLIEAQLLSYIASPPLHPSMPEPLHVSPPPPSNVPAELYLQPVQHGQSSQALSPLPPSESQPPPGKLRTLNYLNRDQFIQMQSLIHDYGEDWERLSKMMGIRPRDLSKNWIGHSLATEITKAWTHDEMVILYLCRELDICCRRTAKIISTKLPLQCRRKNLTRTAFSCGDLGPGPHRQSGSRGPGRRSASIADDSAGAPDDEAKKDDEGEDGEDIRWETGHDGENFFRGVPMPTTSIAAVTQAVRECYLAHGRVDWAAISAQTSQPVIACMEQNQFSEGKVRWAYDSESFSWDLANAMHSFIVQHYPAPAPIDFAAVSNVLWVQLPDCIRMFRMLRGEFEWTPEAQRRAGQLASLGLTNTAIARVLSPTMGGRRVAEMLHRCGVNAPPTPMPRRVDAASEAVIRDVIARYFRPEAPNASVVLECACRMLPELSWRRVYESTLIILSQHPCIDVSLGRRRRHHSQPARTAAGQPRRRQRGSSAPARETRWSDEETRLLVRYAQSSRTTLNWRYFAAYLGTKTKSQCSTKYRNLSRNGMVRPTRAASPGTP